MKRFAWLMVLAVVFGMVSQAYAGLMRVENLVGSDDDDEIAMASQATVYTKAFKIKSGEYFGLSYMITTDIGSPSGIIELEQGYDLPTTEGASDDEWAEPDNMADIATGITTETRHYISFSPIPTPYARFKITNSGGSFHSKFSGKVFIVEED
jgi:hypothetical protein